MEGNFNDMVNTIGRVSADGIDGCVASKAIRDNDMMSPRPLCH